MMQQLNCYLEDEIYKKVEKIAKEENNSISRIGSRLIKQALTTIKQK